MRPSPRLRELRRCHRRPCMWHAPVRLLHRPPCTLLLAWWTLHNLSPRCPLPRIRTWPAPELHFFGCLFACFGMTCVLECVCLYTLLVSLDCVAWCSCATYFCCYFRASRSSPPPSWIRHRDTSGAIDHLRSDNSKNRVILAMCRWEARGVLAAKWFMTYASCPDKEEAESALLNELPYNTPSIRNGCKPGASRSSYCHTPQAMAIEFTYDAS
mgnify:CR=1 FL=1